MGGGKSIYVNTAAQCLSYVMKHCAAKAYFVHSSEKKNNCPSFCAALTGSGRWDGRCGDCAGCGCVSAKSISTSCPSRHRGNWLNNCDAGMLGLATEWATPTPTRSYDRRNSGRHEEYK